MNDDAFNRRISHLFFENLYSLEYATRFFYFKVKKLVYRRFSFFQPFILFFVYVFYC